MFAVLRNAIPAEKNKYKLDLRNQKIKSVNCIRDLLNECHINKNKTEFWKTWKAKFGS